MWEKTFKVLEEMGIESIESFKQKMNSPDPYSSNATYTLYNSANYKIVINNASLKLLFTAPDEYYDKTTNKLWLEQGRKAGGPKPPISVIKKWVIDRSIPVAPYLIQRSIAVKGIRPKPYIQEIRKELLLGDNIDKLTQAILDDVKELLKIK